MKKIVVLGSTGSIGRQTLEIIRSYPNHFRVVGLSANTNEDLLKKQALEFKPIATGVREENLEKIATLEEADLVVVAVVGLAGLGPTLAAIEAGKDIALATKEVLVVAGELVVKKAKDKKVRLLPIDSEHSAIFQCLKAGKKKEIRRLIITMGKGPIAKMNIDELGKVTMRDIFRRPAWKLGKKIAIDSATCLNKSFEVIEAKWLFGIKPEQIDIVVHPEYLCHSMVEFKDGSIIAEIGSPDMKRYIQYVLFYPKRVKANTYFFTDLIGKKISFESPPLEKFPGLRLGFEAIEVGGTMSAVMHGADYTAVDAFARDKIGFLDIPEIVKKTMKAHSIIKTPKLDEILQAELWGQNYAKEIIYG